MLNVNTRNGSKYKIQQTDTKLEIRLFRNDKATGKKKRRKGDKARNSYFTPLSDLLDPFPVLGDLLQEGPRGEFCRQNPQGAIGQDPSQGAKETTSAAEPTSCVIRTDPCASLVIHDSFEC
jgi:hypothetical protein